MSLISFTSFLAPLLRASIIITDSGFVLVTCNALFWIDGSYYAAVFINASFGLG